VIGGVIMVTVSSALVNMLEEFIKYKKKNQI